MRRYLLLAFALLIGCRAAWCGSEPSPVHDSDSAHLSDVGVAEVEPDGEMDGSVALDAEAGANLGTLRVFAISDMNGSYGSTEYRTPVTNAISRIVEVRPNLVISLGDMVAGQQPGLDYRAMWAAFHQAVSDPLVSAGIPLAVTPGNHDGSGYASFADERAEFVRQWDARRPEVVFLDASHYPLRYSFVMGAALFISLDATVIGPLEVVQLEWLEAQLEAGADRPAKILFGHLPLHPVSHGREREVLGDPALERLMLSHGVDLYLAGHHHAYYPGRRGELRLVTAAALGGGSRPLLGESRPSPKSIVVLEITSAGEIVVEALGGARFDVQVRRESLPERLELGAMVIRRDDL